MPSPRFLLRFARRSRRWPTPFVCSVALGLLAPPASGQDAALVDALAGILQAEDARQFNDPLLTAGARHPEVLVRQVTALALGRIGDLAAAPILLELLADPDSTVQERAAFSLGLLRDSLAVGQLREFALGPERDQQNAAHGEAVAAIARIGGPEAGAFFRELLGPWASRSTSSAPPLTATVALEHAWRLGTHAPVDLLVELTVSPLRQAKIGAVYSLMRLRSPRASQALLAAIGSREDEMRAYAVRALTATYADSAGLDRAALANSVRRLVSDPNPQVRVNALRALATYRDSALSPVVIDRLSDGDFNVRVQALAALGDLGGVEATEELRDHVERSPFAVQRSALISLARVAGVNALNEIAMWLTEPEWIFRRAGAEALGYVTQDTVVPWIVHMTRDPDSRVAAVALTSLIAVAPDAATLRARALVGHADAVVRTVAVDRLAAVADTADIDLLTQSYQLALRDSISDARIAVVRAMGRIADLGVVERIAVEDRFLTRAPASEDYTVRRAAIDGFPEAARRWGPVTPMHTGRGLEDYRDIARRFLTPEGDAPGELVIETDRGRITLELFSEDAPLTIDAFMQLVDRRYFDGGRWHRVVPNFVVQAGDPRGDGWGGPGYAMRDEVNLHRYDAGTVGIALSGPDTGGSQFFITHSPQPHLDGTYTVIGRVREGMDVLQLITQGDRIRRIRRP
jgi:cyclophilin family peptidyl-prolyl cis-trans isomerase/HEAT repeat protein